MSQLLKYGMGLNAKEMTPEVLLEEGRRLINELSLVSDLESSKQES